MTFGIKALLTTRDEGNRAINFCIKFSVN